MKTKIFTLFIVVLGLSAGTLRAQMLLEENFDYDTNRPLIMDAINNSDNFDGVTGWSTQNNSKAGTNCFTITDAPLTYPGYAGSGIGYALKYNGDDGQGPFKAFLKNIKNDSTIYIAFMINFPNTAVSGGDYFLGIKMDASATQTNWGGRIFAAVDPTYQGEEVSIGINKMSGGTTTWVNAATGPFLPANTTHLFVVKYHVGIIAGETAAEEAGKFDDIMSLFVNPPLTGGEPETPTLQHIDPTQNDLYRRSSTGSVIGGARAIYLRPSVLGNAPAYTIDGIRVGESWEAVTGTASAVQHVVKDIFNFSIKENTLTVKNFPVDCTAYEITGISGQRLLEGSLAAPENSIDVSSLSTGIYLLSLKGTQLHTAKIIINR